MLLRILMGLVIGCFAPLGATMLAELTPKSLRGLLMSILTVTLCINYKKIFSKNNIFFKKKKLSVNSLEC